MSTSLLYYIIHIILCKVVDTPGFGDTEGRDNEFIVEMMDVLNNELQYTNIIALVIEGSTPRFGEPLYNMLRQMTSIFGDKWWDFMVVAVSKWSYKQGEIDVRNQTCTNYPDMCQDEKWFVNEFNDQFQKKFHLSKNFTFAFVDSWSQIIGSLEDPIQQEHWIEGTNKLWEEAIKREDEPFHFLTIDDILKENAELKAEVLVLEQEVEDLKQEVEDLKDDKKEIFVTNAKVKELHILTGSNGCDNCEISIKITGPDGDCDTGSLDDRHNNFGDGCMDRFSDGEISGCHNENLGDVR